MRLLLDTHIWIWSLVAPERLTPAVREALSDADSELWLSAVSVWETLVLVRKGRLTVAGAGGVEWVRQALGHSPVREAPMTFEIAMASERLALDHWDPADRFIAATSQVLEASLVTADERLIGCRHITVLANG